MPSWLWITGAVIGGVVAAVLAIILVARLVGWLLPRWLADALVASRFNRYPASLWSVAPLMPSLALAASVVAYFAWNSAYALLIGSGVAITAWLSIALLTTSGTTISQANVRTYGDFLDRLRVLDCRIRAIAKELEYVKSGLIRRISEACAGEINADPERAVRSHYLEDARCHWSAIEAEQSAKDFRWVRGHGYNNLWVSLHGAEAAVLAASSTGFAVTEGLYDESRLFGSEIPAKQELLQILRNAIAALDPGAVQFFLAPFNAPAANPPIKPEAARGVLWDVRTQINNFNDSRYDALIRIRNGLLDLVPFGGLMSMLGLAVVVLTHPKGQETQIEAGTAFYIFGVTAGLLWRWYVELKTEKTVQDFGLASARLFRTLVFSGIAGIVGVIVAARLLGAVGADPTITGQSEITNTPASTVATPAVQTVRLMTPEDVACPHDKSMPLRCVFDLGENSFGLVLALVFGATPEALLNILKLQGDKYVQQLSSAKPGQVG